MTLLFAHVVIVLLFPTFVFFIFNGILKNVVVGTFLYLPNLKFHDVTRWRGTEIEDLPEIILFLNRIRRSLHLPQYSFRCETEELNLMKRKNRQGKLEYDTINVCETLNGIPPEISLFDIAPTSKLI